MAWLVLEVAVRLERVLLLEPVSWMPLPELEAAVRLERALLEAELIQMP